MTTPETFWNFAVRTYRCQGVPEACLALQDERGADVNVVLFCCWMGATRGVFKTEDFDAMLRFSRSWAEHVVRPLRGVRSWMKTAVGPDPVLPDKDCMDLRERVKSVEFAAEHLQEDVMESMVGDIAVVNLSAADQVSAAILNLRRYCAAETIDWSPQTQQRLAVILRQAIPGGAEKVSDALG